MTRPHETLQGQRPSSGPRARLPDMIVRSHIGFKTASIAFQFCCCFHTMHRMFYMTAASYHVVRWLLLPAPCAAVSVISRHARPQNMMPMRLLDDHTLFVDNLFEANRRTLNSTKYELIHGTPKLILELNMVAEQNAAEPSLRRAGQPWKLIFQMMTTTLESPPLQHCHRRRRHRRTPHRRLFQVLA